MQERLGFDNEIAALEKAIKTRRRDLRELETVCSDAQLSLEMSKVEIIAPPHIVLDTYRCSLVLFVPPVFNCIPLPTIISHTPDGAIPPGAEHGRVTTGAREGSVRVPEAGRGEERVQREGGEEGE